MQKLNIPPSQLENQKEVLRGGVPYVIPAAVGRELGRVWLDAVDAFPSRDWTDIMYAFGLAATMLGLEVTRTDVVDTNLRQSEQVRRKMIHYCYGDETWDKRNFFRQKYESEKLWAPSIPAKDGTILKEILDQIVEARRFYENLQDASG